MHHPGSGSHGQLDAALLGVWLKGNTLFETDQFLPDTDELIYLFIYLLPIHSTTLQANKQTLLWRRRQPKAQMRHTRDAPDYLNIRKIYTNRNGKVLVILNKGC